MPGTTENTISDFDDIVKIIGGNGKYQKRLIYGFLAPFSFIIPLLVLNIIFMLHEPNHWCYVPGKPIDLEQELWKNLTIPTELSLDGISLRLNSCEMYTAPNFTHNKACNTKWEYDRSNYKETLISEFNWVCDKSHYATQAFTVFSIGNTIGTLLFGFASDKFGRKPIFFIIIFINIISRLTSLFIANYFHIFLLMQFLVGTSFPMLFILPATQITEFCDNDFRAKVYSVGKLSMVIGTCFLPLIAYLTSHWFWIGIITIIPGFLTVGYIKWFPESPRLLLAKGNIDDAKFYIEKIINVNGKDELFNQGQLKPMLEAIVFKQQQQKDEARDKEIGFWTLFSRFTMAKCTINLCIVWSVNVTIYVGITLNTIIMAGNPFLNFFILSAIELPAGWICGFMVEKIGRRWTQTIFLFLCVIGFLVAGFATFYNMAILVMVFLSIAKLAVSITSILILLQGNEILCTKLRGTGVGFITTIANLFATSAPAIVYLHKIHIVLPYATFTWISLIGTIFATFLPETLGQNLPETVEDSIRLCRNTKYWSFSKQAAPTTVKKCDP